MSVGTLATAVLAAVGLAATPTTGGADALEQVRQATSPYRDIGAAIDAGYVQFFGCVHEPLAGSMGIHFVNGALAGDGVVDVATPEAVMYEPAPDGTLTLIGVEYVVFEDAWDAANTDPPELFGQRFNLVEEPNRYGIPSFYELHAWAWKANPSGDFEDWNPAVVCPSTEGHH
jgi:hypothetical protein